MDSIVPSGSDTVPPSLPVDVSLHLYGGGNLECFMYGHKCDLLSTSNSSLVKEVIAIEDLGGNHILAFYADGRMAVLTVSWPAVFAISSEGPAYDVTICKAITTDLVTYLLKCFPFPPIVLGQLIHFIVVLNQGVLNDEYPLNCPSTPLGWVLAVCMHADVDVYKVIGLWESQESIASQYALFHALRQALSTSDAVVIKSAVLGFLINSTSIENTNCDLFVSRCSLFIKDILGKLKSIGISKVKGDIELTGTDYTLSDTLVKVFYRRYNESSLQAAKDSSPYVHVLEAFLAAVLWLSSNVASSSSSAESSSVVVFHTLPPTIQVAIRYHYISLPQVYVRIKLIVISIYVCIITNFLFLLSISFSCRLSLLEASTSWPNWLLRWIGRTDIIASRSPSRLLMNLTSSIESSPMSSDIPSSSGSGRRGQLPTSSSLNTSSATIEELDGLKMVEKLCTWRFPEDERLVEVRVVMCTNTITITY